MKKSKDYSDRTEVKMTLINETGSGDENETNASTQTLLEEQERNEVAHLLQLRRKKRNRLGSTPSQVSLAI